LTIPGAEEIEKEIVRKNASWRAERRGRKGLLTGSLSEITASKDYCRKKAVCKKVNERGSTAKNLHRGGKKKGSEAIQFRVDHEEGEACSRFMRKD